MPLTASYDVVLDISIPQLTQYLTVGLRNLVLVASECSCLGTREAKRKEPGSERLVLSRYLPDAQSSRANDAGDRPSLALKTGRGRNPAHISRPPTSDQESGAQPSCTSQQVCA